MGTVSVNIQQLYQGLKMGWKEFARSRADSTMQRQAEFTALRQRIAKLELREEQLLAKLEASHQENAAHQALSQELTTRNEELKAFARTVAHDLNGPINIVVGMAEILKMDYRDALIEGSDPEGQIDQYLEALIKSARHTSSIVESILLFAHWEREEVQIDPLDMSGIVKEAQDRLEHMVQSYKAEVETPQSWPLAAGYGPWVEEVWANYLSNAVKYGGCPAKIQLGATPVADGMIRFWVKDNGPGLSAEEQAKLFTPFTRLAKDTIEGSGLGLSIVKSLINKLGGQVGIESRPGQGSTFYFTLPVLE